MLDRFNTSAAPLARTKVQRYTAVAQWLHWLTALLVFAVLPIAWVMVWIGKDNPNREMIYTIHKSIGLTILVLAVGRLVWRARHPAPPLPSSMARWETGLVKLNHWLLYFILLIMPISGYVFAASGRHPLAFFGMLDLPLLPQNKAVGDAARWVHLTTQWAVYALLALHIIATAWHIVVRRDGTLDRMLPEQFNAE
jgi:cytochrome b561